MVSVSPRIAVLLNQVTATPDLESALLKVLSEYIDLKVAQFDGQISAFEAKWGMTFAEFSDRFENDQLDQDSYSYDVEKDFWDWEKAETLKKHYLELRL